ncbi:Ig-like domain-containing protein [Treponema pedis]|uniref:Ig-like domain-containing protein n=2 Tax=Treponema pedis TaxID=409322 RepID=UPI0004107168|nr:Ig-like domain-containing protein [Treponema pedis]
MKKWICFVLAYLCFFAVLYAGGSKDISTVNMSSLESWQESLDISGKKKGKYNILITAKDIAGNEGYYGPFNMYIEPNSDLPIVHISSPVNEAGITGNINVVGTCIDDDGVAYVEIKIDGGEESFRAKGKEFWSYYINTADFEEGMHTVEACGVDVNGVRGVPVKKVFHLDRRQPKTDIENKAIGELVSGKISLQGTVQDGNGIERLLYSLDDGNKFEEIKLSYNKKTEQSFFKLNINTKNIPDGPKVCWFKAVDKQGSSGIYTFLFFVDNTAPTVEFVYPEAGEEKTGSVFSVSGKAFDIVGLESLTWKCGKESGKFEITPGNYYWVKEFDLTKEGGKSAVIEIIAKDIAGNIVSAKKTVAIDKGKDLPVVEILSPKENSEVINDLFISGAIHGNYEVNEIRYKIDNGEEKNVPASLSLFNVLESGLSSGVHTLTVYAVNKYGIRSNPVNVKFKAAGGAPSALFKNGQTVIPSYNNDSCDIYVKAEAGLKYVSAGFNGEGEAPVQIKPGQTEYIIKSPVTAKSETGIYTVSVTAVDTLDRKTVQTLVIGVAASGGRDGEGYFAWAAGNKTDTGAIVLSDNGYIPGVYLSATGAAIESVQVTGGSGVFAETEGNLIKLFCSKDGLFKGVGVKITDVDGAVYTCPIIDIYSDISVPKIILDMPQEPSFIKNSITVKGSVSDGAGIKSAEYSIGDDGVWLPLGTSFNEVINVSSKEDGLILLKVRAQDKAGRESAVNRVFYKDSAAPEVTMIEPVSGDKVNGSVYAVFKVSDEFPGVKAEYKSGGKDSQWKEFEYNSLPHLIIGSAAEPINKNMQFRFTDTAGNVKVFDNFDFSIDNSIDIPRIELHLPLDNEVIFKDFEISGIVYDDDAPAKIYYKIDNGAYKQADIKNSFAVPVQLQELTDNEHTITVYGEDIYGVKSAPVSRKIRVSLEVPSASVSSPAISETVKGTITVSGTASDKNGIKQVEISFNNGNTFTLAEGKENWNYTLNTHIIDDGTHVIFVKATDNYGQTALFSSLINIDNTPPILKFEYPLSGAKLDSTLFVSGHTRDNISLEGVTLKIKSLSGTQVPSKLAEIKLETNLLVSKEIDISALAEGRYNLEISGVDKAENITETALNFDVYRKKDKNRIELLYPLNGETVRGEFNVYGRVISDEKIAQAVLYLDGNQIESTDISKTSYVSFKLTPEILLEGSHKIEIRAMTSNGKIIVSNAHGINYEKIGPWITIDNFSMGDFAIERPYLKGRAGYTVSEEELENINSKQATAEEKRTFKAKRVKKVEVSFNNGKSFTSAKIGKEWKYRIETEDMTEGNHFLLVRATMENNEIAVCRTIIKIDKTVPSILLISPGEGGKYNGSIEFTGITSDNAEISGVEASLRKGDKANYGVPKFIQGLHFELGFWGASLWNMGVGLSFFDNNVKLQFHYGQFLQSQFNAIYGKAKIRYGGHIISLKLLANIYTLPFGYYFGPDWKWLYMNITLGTQFSLFTDTQSKRAQVLPAMLVQLEFPRVKFHKQKFFSAFSFFTEGQLWFIPTDVNSAGTSKIKSVVPHISAGVRLDIF